MAGEQFWEIRFRLVPPPGSQHVTLRELVEKAGFRFVRAPSVCSWCIDAASQEHALGALRSHVQVRVGRDFQVLVDSIRPSLGTGRSVALPRERPAQRGKMMLPNRLAGTPSAAPPSPTPRLRSDGLYEYPTGQRDSLLLPSSGDIPELSTRRIPPANDSTPSTGRELKCLIVPSASE